MIRQYRAGRFQMAATPRGPMPVGTIPVGSIVRPHRARVRVQVLAWIPRDYASYQRGRFSTKRIAGGHLALVRRLDNGRTFTLSDAWLLDAQEGAQ